MGNFCSVSCYKYSKNSFNTLNIIKFFAKKTKDSNYNAYSGTFFNQEFKQKLNLPHISKHEFNTPSIGFYIGASSFEKSWHPLHFAKTLDYIKKNYPQYSVNIYGFGDVNKKLYNLFEKYALDLKYEKDKDFFSFINQHSLQQDISHCKGLKLAISNDSGFVHVANNLNVPSIGIFGFTNGEYYKNVKQDNNFFISNSKLACSPCKHCGVGCKNKTNISKIQNEPIILFNCMVEDRTNDICKLIDKALNKI